MIWLTWRQFRTQALVAVVVLAVLAVWLLVLGMSIRGTVNGCAADHTCGGLAAQLDQSYGTQLELLGDLLLIAPGIMGMFWGAPLVARELETGTHRLVWNQSVTRGRWLTVKLGAVGLAAIAFAGLFSLLLTWAAGPFDQNEGNQFNALVFASRDIVPIAYAAFAFALGTALGLVLRKTVMAMAVTLALFAVIQVAMPNLVRPHLISPLTTTTQMNAAAFHDIDFLGRDANIGGLKIPGSWVISTSDLLTRSGQRVDMNAYQNCLGADFDRTGQCLAKLDLHVVATYQPPDRYWPLQWLESLIFGVLAGLLVLLARWRIGRRVT
ncbi:MAG TPA: ABC transporter permease subunit [Pseudonocardiaceae bacterium]|nr:ABC transporter permease subunit [Pseudonocardiaceae bacterium]